MWDRPCWPLAVGGASGGTRTCPCNTSTARAEASVSFCSHSSLHPLILCIQCTFRGTKSDFMASHACLQRRPPSCFGCTGVSIHLCSACILYLGCLPGPSWCLVFRSGACLSMCILTRTISTPPVHAQAAACTCTCSPSVHVYISPSGSLGQTTGIDCVIMLRMMNRDGGRAVGRVVVATVTCCSASCSLLSLSRPHMSWRTRTSESTL